MGIWNWFATLAPAQATIVGTAFGALFGFVSLTLGALWNASLTRRRDNRLRYVSSASLLRAIHSEITTIKTICDEHAKSGENNARQPGIGGIIVYDLWAMASIFSANLGHLDLIPADSVKRLTLFYGRIREHALHVKEAGGMKMVDTGSLTAFTLPLDRVGAMIGLYKSYSDGAAKALATLEQDLKLIDKLAK